jgi:hypothetical protein
MIQIPVDNTCHPIAAVARGADAQKRRRGQERTFSGDVFGQAYLLI